jgi:hypothetical protein
MSLTTFTIEKDQLPSKLYSITFRKPLFRDYRNARKRFPSDQRVPYSLEELLFAMCMEGVNGNQLVTTPRDMAERLDPFPIADRQFLLTLFIEMFFLSKDQSKAAEEIADGLLVKSYTGAVGIKAQETPSQEVSFIFNPPNTGVQMEVDRQYQGISQSGATLEETLMAFCINTMNGMPVEEKPKDIISLLDEVEIADVQFAAVVFVNTFTIDNDGVQKAKKLAQLLKPNKSSSKVSSTGKTTTQVA